MDIRPAHVDEVDGALALVASYTATPAPQAVAALRQAARRGDIDLDRLTVAVDQGRLLGAALGVISPGRTAFVTLPGAARRRFERDVAVALLRHWREGEPAQGLAMVQVFVAPHDRRRQAFIEEAGFEHLADLIHLERDRRTTVGEAPLPPGLAWRTYGPDTHDDFAQVIAETYHNTLDCPRLSGLRTIEDTIAGHKSQGRFNPERWFILEADRVAAGCLLLNLIPERTSLDITYMGLASGARGRGFGRALVQKAIDLGRQLEQPFLTCAVDAGNLPAIKTYARFNFRSLDTKRVYVAVPRSFTST
jgi:ribosomal protein S18 acetylase RimI-like enzyme